MRHENILGFIAADIRGTSGTTSMLLITDYHKIGSLYDFLKSCPITEEQMIKLAHSVASGLSHLHLEIHGARGKPAIVHRDIKSRNILVKQNLTCAIADFGLAVKYDSSSRKTDFGHHNARVGTVRYMSPELLSQTINCQDFEALIHADMYSFALVLWELCSRTRVQPIYDPSITKESQFQEKKFYADEMPYNLPYSEYVDADPTCEDMNSVVNIKKIRPSTSYPAWKSSKVLSEVCTLMKECWQTNPSARPPMLRAKKTLSAQKDTLLSNSRQPLNTNAITKENYSWDKKESLSTDSDNYSQNSSLTNSNPSQENGVKFV